ncbi:hypothetical protein MLD38_021342 [Melastoma candidum]|uniref:Uncharacterized protein n=1 Tax=Melastoma candidum TaxID=119954 RepID=A0ACB9QH05_9MYRT|nr:hypothetical protein MLD38_021342 [Melastoma candidum]
MPVSDSMSRPIVRRTMLMSDAILVLDQRRIEYKAVQKEVDANSRGSRGCNEVGESSRGYTDDDHAFNDSDIGLDTDIGVVTDDELYNDPNAGYTLNEDVDVVEVGDGYVRRKEKPLPFYNYYDDDDGIGPAYSEYENNPLRHESDLTEDFRKGMRFKDKKELILVVNNYHIQNHFNYEILESDKKLWSLSCSELEKGCKWRLCVIQRACDDKFEITIMGAPHTCINPMLSCDHEWLDSDFMAPLFRQFIRDCPETKVSFLRNVIKEKYGYDVPMRRVWEPKRKSTAFEYGDWGKSYNELPHLLNVIRTSNPGTCIDWGGSYTVGDS